MRNIKIQSQLSALDEEKEKYLKLRQDKLIEMQDKMIEIDKINLEISRIEQETANILVKKPRRKKHND